MRAVVQRVSSAVCRVGERTTGEIRAGLCVLLGIGAGDGEAELRFVAHKIANLRIFPDAEGKLNRSALDCGYGILLVPNFTVAGDCKKGLRPNFTGAMPPDAAKPLFDRFAALLAEEGIAPALGEFGADMAVSLVNDGPVTVVVEKDPDSRETVGN